jgi:hypothetical protein
MLTTSKLLNDKEKKETPFDRLIQTVVDGNADQFDMMVQADPTLLDQTIPETGDTIAHVIAVQSRQPKFFFRLQLHRRLDLFNKTNHLGTLPMHYAALFNTTAMVKQLCEMQQDKKAVHSQVTSVIHAVEIPEKLKQILKQQKLEEQKFEEQKLEEKEIEEEIKEELAQKPESALKMSTYRMFAAELKLKRQYDNPVTDQLVPHALYNPIGDTFTLVDEDEILKRYPQAEKCPELKLNLQRACRKMNSFRSHKFMSFTHPSTNVNSNANAIRLTGKWLTSLWLANQYLLRCENSDDAIYQKKLLEKLEELCEVYDGLSCSELANLAKYVFDQGKEKVLLETFSFDKGDHAFLVFGREAKSNESDYKNWGEAAVVCDIWSGTICLPHEIPEKMMCFDWLENQVDTEDENTLVYPFNPNFDSVKRYNILHSYDTLEAFCDIIQDDLPVNRIPAFLEELGLDRVRHAVKDIETLAEVTERVHGKEFLVFIQSLGENHLQQMLSLPENKSAPYTRYEFFEYIIVNERPFADRLPVLKAFGVEFLKAIINDMDQFMDKVNLPDEDRRELSKMLSHTVVSRFA